MATARRYHGWAEVLDEAGAVLERVWAALAWENGEPDAAWSGQLTPLTGQADFLEITAQVGRVLGLRLLADDDPVDGTLILMQHYPPLLREGALVRTAVLDCAGHGPLRCPAAACPEP